ncbi:MAG TPA: YbfB/YjiJ family MFS transporter [Trueperaceae bacterium]
MLLGVLLGFAPGSAIGIGRFGYGLVLPLMQADLGLTLAQAGLVGSANTGGYLLGAVASHAVLGRVGYRRGVYASLFLQAATVLALWLGPPYWLLLALRLAQGVLGALVFVGGAALLLSSGARATAMGLYFGGMGAGLVLSTLALPFGDGWRTSWGLLGLAALAMALVALPAAPRLREPPPRRPEEGGGLGGLAPALAAYALYGAGYIGYMTFVTSGLRAPLAQFWVVLGVGAALTGVAWGPVIDRLGGAPGLRLVLLVLAVSSLAPLLAAAPYASALLFGVSFLGVITALTTLFRERLPAGEWARAMGLSTAAFATGQALGPALSGVVGDALGGVGAALWSATALLAASLLLSFVPLRAPVRS